MTRIRHGMRLAPHRGQDVHQAEGHVITDNSPRGTQSSSQGSICRLLRPAAAMLFEQTF